MDLTVLGCSGSFGSPSGGACSGYLLRSGQTAIWMDCGNGTFANLQHHIPVEDVDAIVISHLHPDHCVDLYGAHVLLHYGLEKTNVPVYGPAGHEARLGALVEDWGETFAWHEIGDGDSATVGDIDLRFSRTDHPPPTFAVEARGDGKRLIYTSDTGPKWSVDAFEVGADLVLSEATYAHANKPAPLHLSAHEAGAAARAARARRLMITHLWPRLDPQAMTEEAAESFGAAVTLAAPHQRIHI